MKDVKLKELFLHKSLTPPHFYSYFMAKSTFLVPFLDGYISFDPDSDPEVWNKGKPTETHIFRAIFLLRVNLYKIFFFFLTYKRCFEINLLLLLSWIRTGSGSTSLLLCAFFVKILLNRIKKYSRKTLNK